MTEPAWLKWAKRLNAIAQAGLTYSTNPFEIERCEQIRAVAAEILADYTGTDLSTVNDLLTQESGYPTPKLDVRGAVFRDGAILLVHETSSGAWTLPGGWIDVGETPREAVEKEVREESGYEVRARKLVAVYDRDHQGHTPHPNAIYKLFFICELTGGAASGSIETDGVGFFLPDALPPLDPGRTLPGQVALCFAHHADPTLPTVFD
ncbi:MAG: NUDIX hydrolase [Anaerolineae bacterium]|nr:NUDIX hydrolase [Anaerolineae bacterium]